ncbi:MAG: succinate dehydrogenase/fumarate reductase iron-sulfur subunit [Terriglobales bacterium]
MNTATRTICISRSGADDRRTFQSYRIEPSPELTVLDALFAIQREQDPTVGFRCSCRVGMCGTCAIRINGVARLACKTRLTTLDPKADVVLMPLSHFPVARDLAIQLDPFFEQWRKVRPAFRPSNPESRELARVPADSPYGRHAKDKRDCITCGACFAACSIPGMNKRYLGPAAINKALLRILDPRDTAHEERMEIVNDRNGVWRCHTQFNCSSVCPQGINLTAGIALLKRGELLHERDLGS